MTQPPASQALRAVVHGAVQGVGFRWAAVQCARELGVMGWVRNADDGTVQVHAEGDEPQLQAFVAFLREGPPGARVTRVQTVASAVEGHEQFAVRGVSAGGFVVAERAADPLADRSTASTRGPVRAAPSSRFELSLEVGAVVRAWALPRGPSLDPAARRLAVQLDDRPLARESLEEDGAGGRVIVWDRGTYEQGGRVAWPLALQRGHAVFVLHGEKLSGGFALQRTRPGPPAQWLLIKRRDGDARPGCDVVAERPGSVLSGRTLDDLT